MFYKRLFRYGLSRIAYGRLTVREDFAGGEEYVFAGVHPGYNAAMVVSDPYFYKHAVLYGEIGFGEAFVAGSWNTADLNLTLRWFAQNSSFLPGFSGAGVAGWFMNVLGFVNRVKHFIRPNTQKISRRNIAEHYDLGNTFYELMLGKSMAYSCGIYKDPAEKLDAAQERKFELLCRKLQLSKNDHLLEIGSGWGGFAIYAAKNYGCRITTVTISEQQFVYAKQKILAAKLGHLIDIRLMDYRKLEGRFDKIVSIEMAEAIGFNYFDTYFSKCADLLSPDGLLVLQYITFPESRYEQYLKNTDFTQIYIFPGSCLMSNYEVMRSVHRTSDLMLADVETIGQHYATTLRHWRANVEKNRKEIRGLGYSEKFMRQWLYYLCFCEAGFAERAINDVQVVFTRAHTKKQGDFHAAGKPYLDRL
jgi:cyclopropane-fatty-acyl-phospholipid synthase